MDKFHEQLLTTKKSSLFSFLTVIMVITGFLAVITLSMLTSGFNISILIAFVILAALTVGVFFLRDRQYKEFEYTFTNGNLQIDEIYNMKKRKIVLDKDVKDFEEFGRASETSLSKDVKEVICYPWDKKDSGDKYYILVSDRERTIYYIIPDEEMLKYINIYYKRRVSR